MGKKKNSKSAVIFDDEERRSNLLDRMKANKTRKIEGKKRAEIKIKEEKSYFRREKGKVRRARIEEAREKFEEVQRIADSANKRQERKEDKTFVTDDNERVKVDITYL